MRSGIDPSAPNVFPSEYRQVAVSYETTDLDEETLRHRFIGRDAYVRTRFIVVRSAEQTALIEVTKTSDSELFSPIDGVRVLATPEECLDIEEPDVDVGVASQFCRIADRHPDRRCLIVEGRYSHISFLLNPKPLWITLIDIVPPGPSKLADQAKRMLDVAEDLPPVGLRVNEIDSLELLTSEDDGPTNNLLFPCRTTGVEFAGTDVSFLDQRPPPHPDWTLVGCQRSVQIHASFYDFEPTTIDVCPRRFLEPPQSASDPTLTRCCQLQRGSEELHRTVLVPWGSSLAEVRAAIDRLIELEGTEWTPI